ncbi:MAG: hypothetical protein AAFV98_19185 [Chloroflexota bacterium]
MSEKENSSSLSKSLASQLQPLEDSKWESSKDAMHNYLTLLRKHAEMKAEKAQEMLAEHEEDLDELKKSRRKRRNYGTRTGIIMEGDEVDRSDVV